MMLTTIDNPYNPYKDMDKWEIWDHKYKYNTSEYLARIVASITDVTADIDEEAITAAQLDIIENDLTGIYALIDENHSTPLSNKAYELRIERDKVLNKES